MITSESNFTPLRQTESQIVKQYTEQLYLKINSHLPVTIMTLTHIFSTNQYDLTMMHLFHLIRSVPLQRIDCGSVYHESEDQLALMKSLSLAELPLLQDCNFRDLGPCLMQ